MCQSVWIIGSSANLKFLYIRVATSQRVATKPTSNESQLCVVWCYEFIQVLNALASSLFIGAFMPLSVSGSGSFPIWTRQWLISARLSSEIVVIGWGSLMGSSGAVAVWQAPRDSRIPIDRMYFIMLPLCGFSWPWLALPPSFREVIRQRLHEVRERSSLSRLNKGLNWHTGEKRLVAKLGDFIFFWL